MKIKNITIEKARAALLDGKSIDHGFGGEYDFSEVISSAGLDETLRRLASRGLSPEELSAAAQKIRYLLSSALIDVADELVESWDEQ